MGGRHDRTKILGNSQLNGLPARRDHRGIVRLPANLELGRRIVAKDRRFVGAGKLVDVRLGGVVEPAPVDQAHPAAAAPALQLDDLLLESLAKLRDDRAHDVAPRG